MKKISKNIAYGLLGIFLYIIYLLIKNKKKLIIWGPDPIINNKYWSEAVKEIGYESITLMKYFYPINKRNDFDIYYDDTVPKFLRKIHIGSIIPKTCAFIYVLSNAAVINIPFSGAVFGDTPLWSFEAYIYRKAGIKVIVIPYGSDAYMYSQVIDPCWRHALLINYPMYGKQEKYIREKVIYWHEYADIFIASIMIDGMGRWDISPCQVIIINSEHWKSKVFYNDNDGSTIEKTVKILHTPNHRGTKGTEYLIDAVSKLKSEGLNVELILLEKVPNEKVKEIMQEVDILADQFIATGYAMSALEGMSSGLPVMSNLKNETYTRLLRRYSYLDECPLVSTQPENIKENLRALIKNPKLREDIGRSGRKFVEKYQSYKTAQYIFGSIFERLLKNKEIDLINMFHPILSEYNNSTEYISHPLIENEIPKELVKNV